MALVLIRKSQSKSFLDGVTIDFITFGIYSIGDGQRTCPG